MDLHDPVFPPGLGEKPHDGAPQPVERLTEETKRRNGYNHQKRPINRCSNTTRHGHGGGERGGGGGNARETTYRKPLLFAARMFARSPAIAE